MLGIRQPAGQCPQCLPHLVIAFIPFLFFCEVIHGQPNYYFKASQIDVLPQNAPAVKSLPRIGRRSEDVILPGGLSGDAPLAPNFSLGRSLDTAAGSMIEMWPNSGSSLAESSTATFGGTGSLMRSNSRDRASLVAPQSVIPSSSQTLEKSLLWRRLLGDLNNYEDALENIYHTKT